MKIKIKNEYEMFSISNKIIQRIKNEFVIYLNGKLGSGKTTFARGFIKYAGYKGLINSPTFSILKEYQRVDKFPIYHFDLYRIKNITDIKTIFMCDDMKEKYILLIEWGEKGKNIIPKPDLVINFFQKIHYRELIVYGNTKKGKKILLEIG